MGALNLSGPLHRAYMAGKYAADAEQYVSAARLDKSRQLPYCHWIKAARQANHRMIGCLRDARLLQTLGET
jgi:hypothetical protein